MLIIDRFEGDYAVIEDGGVMINVLRSKLPPDASEGSVLIRSGESYTVDTHASEKRKDSLKSRFDALKKK